MKLIWVQFWKQSSYAQKPVTDMKDFPTRLWTLGVFMAGDVNHISGPCNLLSFLLGLHIGSLLTRGRSKDKAWTKKSFGLPLLNSWYFYSFLRNPPVKTGQSHYFSNGAWRESNLLCTRKTSIKWMFFHLWVTFLTSAYWSKTCLKGFFLQWNYSIQIMVSF